MTMFGFCKSEPNIPIEYLDYKYIESCTDANQLQKILKILRSGEEGTYPQLEEFTEKQLAKQRPDSLMLEKIKKEKMCKDLDKEERADIIKNLKEMPDKFTMDGNLSEESLPPVRSTASINVNEQKPQQSKSSSKRVVPRSYDEWSKLDQEIEKTIELQDNSTDPEVKTEKPVHQLIDDKISHFKATSQEELELTALNEKKKGNEAFQCGDFQEALVYYNRSLQVAKTPAVYNNRAITQIKLKNFAEALKDCNVVIEIEPENMKAYLRRGLARQALGHLDDARGDFEKVLSIEPTNKRGRELLAEVVKALEKRNVQPKKTGSRLVVEEVDSERDERKRTTKEQEQEVNKEGSDAVSPANSTKQGQGGKRMIIEEIDTSEDNDNKTEKSSEKTKNISNELNSHYVENISGKSMVNVDRLKQERCVPASVATKKEEGNRLYKDGQYTNAFDKYTKAIHELYEDHEGLESTLAILFSNRAMCEMKIGRCKDCIHDCTKSISYYPTAKAFMRRAAAYESIEKYEKAYIDYQTALQSDYNNQNALQAISRVTCHLKSINGSTWREKLPKPESVNWPAIGDVTLRERNSESAATSTTLENFSVDNKSSPLVNSTEKVSRVHTKTPEDEFQEMKLKGNSCVKTGDFKGAVSFYSACIKILPQDVTSYTNRALCYVKTSEPKNAVDDCTIALELHPNNVKALFRRALANKMLTEYKSALSDLQSVIKIEPKNTAAKTELEECKQLFKKALLEIQARNESARQKNEKKGKKIKIEEVSSESTSIPSRKTKCPNGRSTKSHPLKKLSAFEFLQSWNSIKSNKSTDYADLLKQIEPTKLPELFSNKLDGGIIGNVINAVHDHFSSKESYQLGIQLLKSLSKTSRFVMMLMFLSTVEKTKLKVTVDLLETRVKQNGGKPVDINYLRSCYNCS